MAALPDDGGRSQGQARGVRETCPEGALLAGAGQGRHGPSGRRLGLGEDDGPRRREVPVERGRPLHQDAPVGDVPGHELLQADGLEPTVGLGHGPRLDLPQGRDRGGVLDRLERSAPSAAAVAGDEDRPVALGPPTWIGWTMAPCRRSSTPDRRARRDRPPGDDALAVDDRDRTVDQLGQRLGDLAEPATGQDDVREPVVDRRRCARSRAAWLVEDDRQDDVDDLVERRLGRQLDEREVVPVGGLDHRGRDRPRCSAPA